MATRFAQIFWGLLLVILDFTINRIDVLPDFIGYILVGSGCASLVGISSRFGVASLFSWVLAILSLAAYVLPNDLVLVFGLVYFALDCAMTWYLLGGIMDLALARQRPDLCQRASNRRTAYILLMGLATFGSLPLQGSRNVEIFFTILLFGCMLPLAVLMLHLIRRVQYELCPKVT